MNREETKKKLVEELKKAMAPIEYGGDREHASEVYYLTEEEIAEALIEAGVRFTESLTATFNKMDMLREHQLVCRLANAEHRAEVAERALRNAAARLNCRGGLGKGFCRVDKCDYYHCNNDEGCVKAHLQQAEKELAEEGKDG